MSVQQSKNTWFFALVESRDGPEEDGHFKYMLEEGTTFKTDFIGTSEEGCRTWAREQMQRVNTIDTELISIADRRTMIDHTILLQFFNDDWNDLEFDGYGQLPAEKKKKKKWYSFRIKYKDSFNVYAALTQGVFDLVYPTYFGRKDELTDNEGIFNVDKAEELCIEQ
ncbi:hypothetical protein F4820DRAFT_464390 [Hypoxylon rubiginosum]|uniref:Uncharacterized protein n=1 Tax=Hypoxylon rubiginosum TaxID=110542 RepID=A0ACB9YRK9_9PEZI|nr:hypothetical protein F4820DRAFT_464390 [Hypoxylon rubiginosum]